MKIVINNNAFTKVNRSGGTSIGLYFPVYHLLWKCKYCETINESFRRHCTECNQHRPLNNYWEN